MIGLITGNFHDELPLTKKNESLLRIIYCLEKGTREGVLLCSAVQLELRNMAKTNASWKQSKNSKMPHARNMMTTI